MPVISDPEEFITSTETAIDLRMRRGEGRTTALLDAMRNLVALDGVRSILAVGHLHLQRELEEAVGDLSVEVTPILTPTSLITIGHEPKVLFMTHDEIANNGHALRGERFNLVMLDDADAFDAYRADRIDETWYNILSRKDPSGPWFYRSTSIIFD